MSAELANRWSEFRADEGGRVRFHLVSFAGTCHTRGMNIATYPPPSILRFKDESGNDIGWRSIASAGVPGPSDTVISNDGARYKVVSRSWDWESSPAAVVIAVTKL